MFKSKLQEFCQSKSWELPEYITTKEGLDHCPKFKASVVVNGVSYFTPGFSKSSKEAQNLAAKLAFDHLSGPSNASPASLVPASSRSCQQPEANGAEQASSLALVNALVIDDENQKGPSNAGPTSLISVSSRSFNLPKGNETVQASSLVGMNAPIVADKKQRDMARMYKNQLQIYAQKRNLNLPVYVSEREGPPHVPRFKCKVRLNEKTYDSQEYFGTIKDAENAAAKVALMSVCPNGIEEEDPGVLKNLLQEIAQKDYSCLPEYNTISSGPPHAPIFISTVDIMGQSYTGPEAKTKKLAEFYAAKVAYSAMKERTLKQISECATPGVDVPLGSSSKLQPIVVPELPQRTISAPDSGFIEASVGRAILSKDIGDCQKDSDFKHVQPVSGLTGYNEPREPSLQASAPHKKIKVFPQPENMTLPPGVNIVHQDEKWIAVTEDASQSNA